VVSLLPTNPSLTLDNISLQPLLDAFLISIQSLISRCPVTTDDGASEEIEDYISNGYKFVRDFTHLLALDKINALIDALLIELSSCANFRPFLTKILPFLEIYLILVKDHLAVHNNWTKSLFKLVFILSSVMQTLSQQGFCQPPISDDNEEGGEVEDDTVGMGIGDGSGNDDVSKEIEDESQIEGLQGDDVENKEREGKHDNEDAIEMDDDFGGALEDILDAGSADDVESDADNEPELDETLENFDDLDNSAVDEKMWGDEKGSEDSRKSEDQTNQDHSKKQDDSSEVVGKEGKEQKQSKEKQSEEIEELEGKDESGAEENEGDESNDPNVSGAPMNDQVPDANTLDLPDDINVSGDDVDMSDGSVDDTGMEQEDDGMEEENQPADNAMPDAMDDDQVPDNALENRESACDVNNDEAKESEHADDEASREVVAPPDISEGVGVTDSTEPSHNEPRDNKSTGELGTSAAGRQGPASTLPDHEKIQEDNR
jgi:midasin